MLLTIIRKRIRLKTGIIYYPDESIQRSLRNIIFWLKETIFSWFVRCLFVGGDVSAREIVGWWKVGVWEG